MAPPKYHSERGHSRSNSAAGSSNHSGRSASAVHLAPPSNGVPAASPSPPPTAHCPHLTSLLNLAQIRQRFRSRTFQSSYIGDTLDCADCEVRFPREHLWACLQCSNLDCTRCGRHHQKHALQHFRTTGHALAIHLSTRVIWCYSCDGEVPDDYDNVAQTGPNGEEVITPQRVRSALDREDAQADTEQQQPAAGAPARKSSVSAGDDEEEEEEPLTYKYFLSNPAGGVTGLSNLGNTCFFNAGTQALLHCPPLIAFFSQLDATSRERLASCQSDASMPQQQRTAQVRVHLVEDFNVLMSKSWSGRYRLCVPKELLQDILLLNPFFRGYGQHDSQEFIRTMLDQLHEAIKCKVEYEFDLRRAQQQAEKEEQEAAEREKQQAAAAAAAEQSGTDSTGTAPSPSSAGKVVKKRYPESSIINDLFGGVLESSVRCSNCGFVSVTRDPFMDLQLEIPREQQLKKIGAERGSEALTPQVNRGFFSTMGAMLGLSTPTLSLETCLHSFCTSDNLLHKDQYKCDKCKVKVDAVKLLALDPHALPEVLAITIKRFSHNSYFGSKISRHVTFPLKNLDMTPFLAQTKQANNGVQQKTPTAQQQHAATKKGAAGARPNGKPASSPAAAAASSIPSSASYDLFAIVRHLGSVSGGHYIAYCRSHVTGKWYEFDDRVVTEFSEAEIAKIEAYVLFYKRVHPVEPLRRVLSMVDEGTARDPLAMLSSAGGNSKPLRYVSRYWLKKMEVLGRPEPIDNRDLCCAHGISKSLPADGGDRALAMTVEGWERLFRELGGGPVVDSAEASVCEQCELPLIRKNERARIAAVDAEANELANRSSASSYLMIDAEWLQQWRAFVQGNGPRPGPISNENLFDEDGETLLSDLKRGVHYRALHALVWQALHDIYGGGPRIERFALDIYSTAAPSQQPQHEVDDEPEDGEEETEEQQPQEEQQEEDDAQPQAQE